MAMGVSKKSFSNLAPGPPSLKAGRQEGRSPLRPGRGCPVQATASATAPPRFREGGPGRLGLLKLLPLLLAGILILLALPLYAAPVSITLKEGIEVTGSILRLGDVARVAGGPAGLRARLQALEVGAAPLPGGARKLDRDSIALRLRGQGVKRGDFELQGPKTITVTAACSPISGDDLLNAVREAILKKFAWKPEDIMVEPAGPVGGLKVPKGEVSLKAEAASELRPSGTTTAPVEILLDGRHYKSVPVTVRVKVMGDVLVASRELARHQEINPGDIRCERRELISPIAAALKPEDLSGKRTTRTIPAGRIITPECVEEIPAVSAGDKVTIQVTVGAVRATLTGIARTSAQVGQTIRVISVDTKKELAGKVIDKGIVEVEG